MLLVINTTFNNISVISWQPFLLMEDTRVDYKGWCKVHLLLAGIKFSSLKNNNRHWLHTVAIGICYLNYHMNEATMDSKKVWSQSVH